MKWQTFKPVVPGIYAYAKSMDAPIDARMWDMDSLEEVEAGGFWYGPWVVPSVREMKITPKSGAGYSQQNWVVVGAGQIHATAHNKRDAWEWIVDHPEIPGLTIVKRIEVPAPIWEDWKQRGGARGPGRPLGALSELVVASELGDLSVEERGLLEQPDNTPEAWHPGKVDGPTARQQKAKNVVKGGKPA